MYFYRFLRTKEGRFHPSEIDNDIEFYTSEESGTDRDFTCNKPVKVKMDSGQSVQLLFGMETLDDAAKVLSCFSCYGRVLARFDTECIDANFSINPDEQVNTRVGSKYIMADYDGKKIFIPSASVQLLSLSGWVAKAEANKVLAEIAALKESEYEQLISNA